MLRWSNIQGKECVQQYQTTPLRWSPQHPSSNETVNYIIGEQKCDKIDESLDFCNGPLKSDTRYGVTLRLFTSSGYADSDIVYFNTGKLIVLDF